MIDIKKSWTFWGGLQSRTDICKFSDINKSTETLIFRIKFTIGDNKVKIILLYPVGQNQSAVGYSVKMLSIMAFERLEI